MMVQPSQAHTHENYDSIEKADTLKFDDDNTINISSRSPKHIQLHILRRK